MFGPPGAGKGTQADILVQFYELHKVSTGDLLRDEIKNNTDLGNKIKFLIDRGDLSKDVSTEMIPAIQRKVFRIAKRKKKEVYVATNFLESMLINKYPTIGEANDIYNTLEMGADGLVLSAETAIGKYPQECVMFLRRMIKTFNKYK